MKKISILFTLLTMISATVSAQIELNPELVWKGGVTVKVHWSYIYAKFDGSTLDYIYTPYDYITTFTLVPETIEGQTYMSDKTHEGMEDGEYYFIGEESYSFKRYEDGKIYCYLFDVDLYKKNREIAGAEYLVHDFDEWAEGKTITYNIPTIYSSTGFIEKKYEITNLQKIYTPDDKYWSWGFKSDDNWYIKGIGPIDEQYYILLSNFGGGYIYSNNMDEILDKKIQIVEILSPEGELYFRHPEYTPEDELGALDMVTHDNHVNITCNAGEVTVTSGTPVEVEIFTAQGMKVFGKSAESQTVCKLQPGLYIVRAGSAVKKVAVK